LTIALRENGRFDGHLFSDGRPGTAWPNPQRPDGLRGFVRHCVNHTAWSMFYRNITLDSDLFRRTSVWYDEQHTPYGLYSADMTIQQAY